MNTIGEKNLRISTDLHQRIKILASKKGVSLVAYANDVLTKAIFDAESLNDIAKKESDKRDPSQRERLTDHPEAK